MRALRVVGVTGDGSVVLEDPGRRERYTVPADEQLRAAARGDVTRLGQIAIELESQLRPREIQARIRGGASVDEVAAAAGVPTQKIERFAYPVLLERSRTAELAQGAHPQRADGPDSRTLGETVAHTFGLRGQDFTSAGWDSWKGEDGKWVVVLTWQTGRSDNAAHWAFQPGAHGGTVVALDEHASDLVEGLPARPLRPLGAVVDMAREDDGPAAGAPVTSEPARAVAGGQAPASADSWAGRGIAPEQRRSSPPPRARVDAPARGAARTEERRPWPGQDSPADPSGPGTGPDAGRDTDAAPRDPAPSDSPAAPAAPATSEGPASTAATASAGAPVSSDTPASPDFPAPSGAPASSGVTEGADQASGEAPATDATATGGPVTRSGPPSTGTARGAAAHRDAADGTAADASAANGVAAHAPAAHGASGTTSDGTAAHGAAPTGATSDGATSDGTVAHAAAAGTDGHGDTAPGRDRTAAGEPSTTEGASASAPAGSASAADAGSAAAAGSAGTPATSRAAGGAGATGTAEAAATSAEPSGTTPDDAGEAHGGDAPARQRGSAASRRTKKGKPVMPSWDEVLLGVRGQR